MTFEGGTLRSPAPRLSGRSILAIAASLAALAAALPAVADDTLVFGGRNKDVVVHLGALDQLGPPPASQPAQFDQPGTPVTSIGRGGPVVLPPARERLARQPSHKSRAMAEAPAGESAERTSSGKPHSRTARKAEPAKPANAAPPEPKTAENPAPPKAAESPPPAPRTAPLPAPKAATGAPAAKTAAPAPPPKVAEAAPPPPP